MKINAIIPARKGSKRIPGKNTKELAGLPLVSHSIISALVSEKIQRVIVSSNDDAVERITARHDGAEFLRRPDELCGDEVGDQPVIEHAIQELKLTGLIAYLRPTTPDRAMYHIEQAIKTIEAVPEATGLRSVELMSESAFKCFTMLGPKLYEILNVDEDWRIDNTIYSDTPNQLCPPTYKPNGYIDVARVDQILAGNLWGDSVIGYITPRTAEIDTMDDWEYAAWQMGRRVEQNLRFGKGNA